MPRRASEAAVILASAFRPFFLLAGAYGLALLLYWLSVLSGLLAPPEWLAPARWHAHEMLFGFAAAAIAGFLLTAVPVWTGARPIAGASLGAMSALWLAGRAAMALSALIPPAFVGAVDVAFLFLLAATVARPIVAARQRRNYGFPIVLALLASANLLFHLEAARLLERGSDVGLRAAIGLVVLLVVVIGGRIVPAFTENALRRTGAPARVRARPWIDRAAAPAVVVALLADLAAPRSLSSGVAVALAALVLGVRMAGWQTLHTLRDPLVWSLHLGYAWLPIGFACMAASDLAGVMPWTSGIHALTAGGFGTMILAVMSRVALGHTGRALSAPRGMGLAYVLVSFGAAVRTAGPLLRPDLALWILVASGALWSAAYALFLLLYAPILASPRVDGRPG